MQATVVLLVVMVAVSGVNSFVMADAADKVTATFEYLDSDGSQFIDAAELQHGFNVTATKMMAAYDMTGDGLSIDEVGTMLIDLYQSVVQ